MEGQENRKEKFSVKKSSRRSSILKDVEGIENRIDKPLTNRRLTLKRVSFADTTSIKEFLASRDAVTEWNHTYEEPVVNNDSASMEITNSIHHENGPTGQDAKPAVVERGCRDAEPVCGSSEAQQEGYEPILDFFSNFLGSNVGDVNNTASGDTSRMDITLPDTHEPEESCLPKETDMEMTCGIPIPSRGSKMEGTEFGARDVDISPVRKEGETSDTEACQSLSSSIDFTCVGNANYGAFNKSLHVLDDSGSGVKENQSTEASVDSLPNALEMTNVHTELTPEMDLHKVEDMEFTCKVGTDFLPQVQPCIEDDVTTRVVTDIEMTMQVNPSSFRSSHFDAQQHVTATSVTETMLLQQSATSTSAADQFVTNSQTTGNNKYPGSASYSHTVADENNVQLDSPVSNGIKKNSFQRTVSQNYDSSSPSKDKSSIALGDFGTREMEDQSRCQIGRLSNAMEMTVALTPELNSHEDEDMEYTCKVESNLVPQVQRCIEEDVTTRVVTDVEMTMQVKPLLFRSGPLDSSQDQNMLVEQSVSKASSSDLPEKGFEPLASGCLNSASLSCPTVYNHSILKIDSPASNTINEIPFDTTAPQNYLINSPLKSEDIVISNDMELTSTVSQHTNRASVGYLHDVLQASLAEDLANPASDLEAAREALVSSAGHTNQTDFRQSRGGKPSCSKSDSSSREDNVFNSISSKAASLADNVDFFPSNISSSEDNVFHSILSKAASLADNVESNKIERLLTAPITNRENQDFNISLVCSSKDSNSLIKRSVDLDGKGKKRKSLLSNSSMDLEEPIDFKIEFKKNKNCSLNESLPESFISSNTIVSECRVQTMHDPKPAEESFVEGNISLVNQSLHDSKPAEKSLPECQTSLRHHSIPAELSLLEGQTSSVNHNMSVCDSKPVEQSLLDRRTGSINQEMPLQDLIPAEGMTSSINQDRPVHDSKPAEESLPERRTSSIHHNISVHDSKPAEESLPERRTSSINRVISVHDSKPAEESLPEHRTSSINQNLSVHDSKPNQQSLLECKTSSISQDMPLHVSKPAEQCLLECRPISSNKDMPLHDSNSAEQSSLEDRPSSSNQDMHMHDSKVAEKSLFAHRASSINEDVSVHDLKQAGQSLIERRSNLINQDMSVHDSKPTEQSLIEHRTNLSNQDTTVHDLKPSEPSLYKCRASSFDLDGDECIFSAEISPYPPSKKRLSDGAHPDECPSKIQKERNAKEVESCVEKIASHDSSDEMEGELLNDIEINLAEDSMDGSEVSRNLEDPHASVTASNTEYTQSCEKPVHKYAQALTQFKELSIIPSTSFSACVKRMSVSNVSMVKDLFETTAATDSQTAKGKHVHMPSKEEQASAFPVSEKQNYIEVNSVRKEGVSTSDGVLEGSKELDKEESCDNENEIEDFDRKQSQFCLGNTSSEDIQMSDRDADLPKRSRDDVHSMEDGKWNEDYIPNDFRRNAIPREDEVIHTQYEINKASDTRCKACQSSTLKNISMFEVQHLQEGLVQLKLGRRPLMLFLDLQWHDYHLMIVRANWAPRLEDLKKKPARLALEALGDVIASRVELLNGLNMCCVEETLSEVVWAYENMVSFLKEIFVIQSTYVTECLEEGLRVIVSSVRAHLCITLNMRFKRPLAKDSTYPLIKTEPQVTIGNLRKKTIEDALAVNEKSRQKLVDIVGSIAQIVKNMSREKA